MDLIFQAAAAQQQSPFFTLLPLEIRESIYRAYLGLFPKSRHRYYVLNLVKLLGGAPSCGCKCGWYYQDVLRVGKTCKRMHDELFELIFRECPFYIDNCGSDFFEMAGGRNAVILSRVQKRIRKLEMLVPLETEERWAKDVLIGLDRASRAFDRGIDLAHLKVYLWARPSPDDVPSADPYLILRGLSEAFRNHGKVEIVDNSEDEDERPLRLFTQEQLRLITDFIQGW
jgi:hypothetical protein